MIEIEPFDDDIAVIKTATSQDGGHPIMWVYSYKVRNSLFDAGCANARAELEEYASKVSIDSVFITHSHEDHCGSVDVFAKKSSIYAWKSGVKDLRDPPELQEFFKFVWGQPLPIEEVKQIPTSFDIGKLHFEVIELPGHFRDMVGFYEPDRNWLFSADAVPLPSRKYIAMPEENIPMMIATMEKILEMDVEVLFDSHRGPIKNPHEHIRKRVDYLKETQIQAIDLHKQGKTVEEIIQELGFEGPWYLEMTKDRFGIDFFVHSLINDCTEG